MSQRTVHNFHVPLPHEIYNLIRAEANRSKKPATVLVREAIIEWLKKREKKSLHSEITDFATRYAGSQYDLDDDLENTSINHLEEDKY